MKAIGLNQVAALGLTGTISGPSAFIRAVEVTLFGRAPPKIVVSEDGC